MSMVLRVCKVFPYKKISISPTQNYHLPDKADNLTNLYL